jgi:hypothetical protein
MMDNFDMYVGRTIAHTSQESNGIHASVCEMIDLAKSARLL